MAILLPDGIVLSPSDLTAAAQCELGWLRRIDVKLERAAAPADDDGLLERIARLGDAHEERELSRLRADREVVMIDRPSPYTPDGLQRAADATAEALRGGAEVVFQAVLYDGAFGGMADFLVRDDEGRYEVWDAKLARRARVPALLQIAAYADQLDRLGIPRAPEGFLLLGDRTRHAQRLDDIVPVFARRRDYLASLVAAHRAQPDPARWGDDRYAICGQCAVCEEGIAGSDDLLAVAGLTRDQRARLRAGGIGTMTALAHATDTVDGMAERTWRTLRDQAAMQIGATDDGAAYEVFDAESLDLLPEPDPGDIFFDFEGDPLWTDRDGVMSGLEYLFGVVDLDEPQGRFTPFWAHDRAEERQALIGFFAYVARRRAEHPGLHIYHYAPYEPTALKRLVARHAYGEDQLDGLLRDGVFVDLYAAVRRSVRVSAPSYSIKKLEPLYMGDQLRDEEGVTTAGDSILQYHEFTAARARGDQDEARRKLDMIADYNEYDCVSTWRLRDWLRSHATGSRPVMAEGTGSREPSKLEELQAVADDLLRLVPEDRAERDDEQQGVALLAAALGYFRREDKPMWWAYFDRAASPVDEWLDPRGTLVAETVQVIDQWHYATAKAKTVTRRLQLTGHLDPGTSLRPGTGYSLVYEDIPPGVEVEHGAHRAIRDAERVVSVDVNDLEQGVVVLDERTTQKIDPFDELPIAVFTHPYIRTETLENAVRSLADATLEAGELPPGPASDILARRAPRLPTGTFDAAAAGESVSARDLTETVRALNGSYVAVQGPPGAGKTYLGTRVVADLVRSGWKVGVVAQSHATVESFLDKLVGEDVGLSAEQVAKDPKDSTLPHPWTTLPKKELPGFLDREGGRVIGGTAWTLAALDPGCLDLVVVDEAGQFSLAHTIAAAHPARRLLLLGDPQQLPQVSQGSHPEPVDASALGWLADGHDTMPADRGYFLSRTWRMHSALTAPVSDLAYEGRLRANESKTDSRWLSAVKPGLHPVAVEHTGNSVVSLEEAGAVVELVRDLLGSTWDPGNAPARAMRPSDVIVVAPYNAQVAAIRRGLDSAGYGDTPVGTVDRFQGQEATVTIVSLAASSAADIPRGLEFLLDRRRLNVAISRGQWASFLVHSPALGSTLPTSIDGLVQLGAFLRLLER